MLGPLFIGNLRKKLEGDPAHPLYRLDKSRSRAFGGSGIGLTIAQSLAQAMGGEIRAESAGPGRGSSFTLTLPQLHK